MTRRVVIFLVAGLLLCACGTISEAQAMKGWIAHSGYNANMKTLFGDVNSSAKDLRRPDLSSNDFHTVCQVLYSDDGAMEAALPTPDAQSTTLLNRAYRNVAIAAHRCYNAKSSVAARHDALFKLSLAELQLSEATARVATASQP